MKIESIKIKHIIETQPDLSYLGKYSNNPAEVHIDRKERGNQGCGEYRYFNLGCGDPEYIEQDYKRAESYNRQEWYVFGVMAVAIVSYSTETVPASNRLETLTSGGLWGIESDSEDYIETVENEQLDDLREHLAHFGIVVSDENWNELCEQAKGDIVEDYDD